MSNLVVLEILHSTSNQNLLVKLLLEEDGELRDTGIRGTFPSVAQIIHNQERWLKAYRGSEKVLVSRLEKVTKQTIAIGKQTTIDCQEVARKFDKSFNEWFNSKHLRPFQQEMEQLLKSLEQSGEIRVVVKTTESWMWKLPWHRWDVFRRYSCEVAMSLVEKKRLERPNPPKPRARIRILAILGDSTGISTKADRELLEKLPESDAEIIWLKEPKRWDLYQAFWNPHGFDILFFAGHSASEANGARGQISINKTESLSIGELKKALEFAIRLDLKLAIFNSCDGLGLARELADLYIPHLVVFRELVPDRVAQEFLTHFLTAYSNGKSLYTSMREVREKLQLLENDFPCASWLPVICQNPADAPLTWLQLRGSQTEASWRACCRAMLALAAYNQLSNNPLTNDELGFELEEIDVPLGLVERRKPDRHTEDFSPEQGSQLYQPEPKYEITKTYQRQEFFEQVLHQGQSPKSQGRRLVIIGEPGAGKTRLLQKIGDWVLENTTEDVPIWISLANLQQGQSLRAYLQQNWFAEARQTVRVPGATKSALVQLFQSGKVWLLLDGVDEFTTKSVNPISELISQITDWVAQAKVVLTCRLNLWEAGKNALETFDTYRNSDFSYGNAQNQDQVGNFIGRWFAANSERGKRLRVQLDEQGRERIKDLVKNPLRLSLLCRIWQWQQGNLPQTKAELYRQFTEAVYEWKQGVFPTTKAQQQALNAALGRLAQRSLDQEESWFRLQYHLVAQQLAQPIDSQSQLTFLQLALQLGWLNQVGVVAENSGEPVYAFFHPTFQEYFAAQVTDDWHHFLNHDNDNPKLVQGNYRIFEPQWKEPIVLWLGRPEPEVPNQEKEDFFKALVMFKDGCGNFYWYQAFSLAAAGIAEYPNCSRADLIVTQLVTYGFPHVRHELVNQPEHPTRFRLIADKAKVAIKETDHPRVINALMSIHPIPIYFLTEITTSSTDDIRTLTYLVQNHREEDVRLIAARQLLQIDRGNQVATDTLINMLRHSQSSWIYHRVAKCLTGNLEAIAILVDLLRCPRGPFDTFEVPNILAEIGVGNPKAITDLSELIHNSPNDYIQREAISILEMIGAGDSAAIAVLINLLHTTKDNCIRWQIIESLGKIGTGSQDAIKALSEILHTSQDRDTRRYAAESLARIVPSKRRRKFEALRHLFMLVYKNLSAPLMNLLQNRIVRAVLQGWRHLFIYLLRNASNALLYLHRFTNQNEDSRLHLIERLIKFDPGNPKLILGLVELLHIGQSKSTCQQAAQNLKEILRGQMCLIAVSGLRDCLREGASGERHDCCYEVIWHCAENLAYPDFYQAWHSQSSVSHARNLPSVHSKLA